MAKHKSNFSRAGKRLRELERLIRDRHGAVPDTDDAEFYLTPVAQCFRKILVDKGKPAAVDDVVKRFGFWCEKWAPRLGPAEIERVASDATLTTWTSDDRLGAHLRLTHADRSRLRITTIGSHDVDRKSRKKLQRAKKRQCDRIRAEMRRRAKGAKPRADYEAQSLSRTRPWEQIGISKRTYYRRLANGSVCEVGTGASHHPSLTRGDGLVPLAPTGAEATTPPAVASGTPNRNDLEGVDAAGVVGNPDADRQRRTRFPTAMRLTKEMAAYAREAGFDLTHTYDLFDHFRQWNVAMRSYSTDWTETWLNWVDRQVTFEIEDHYRQRARSYYEGQAAY